MDAPAGTPSLTRALLEARRRPVDAQTRRRAVLHWIDWIDWIGCVAAGALSPVGTRVPRMEKRATWRN